MGKSGKIAVLAGLGLAALVMTHGGAGWASVPTGQNSINGACLLSLSGDPAPVALAGGRGGGRGGRGAGNAGDDTGWKKGSNSMSGQGSDIQDRSGSGPRPQDGTGYGAGQGAGSGDCDGTGPKGKGRSKQNN